MLACLENGITAALDDRAGLLDVDGDSSLEHIDMQLGSDTHLGALSCSHSPEHSPMRSTRKSSSMPSFSPAALLAPGPADLPAGDEK